MTPYTFTVNGGDCPVCGISAFDHVHPDGTKPKEFKMLTPAKERGENPWETWEERFRQKLEGANIVHSDSISTPVMNEMISDIASEIQSAVEAERKRIIEEINERMFHCEEDDCMPFTKDFIRNAIQEAVDAEYEKGFTAGQKKAFGVDRERVKEEGRQEERRRILSLIEERRVHNRKFSMGVCDGADASYADIVSIINTKK